MHLINQGGDEEREDQMKKAVSLLMVTVLISSLICGCSTNTGSNSTAAPALETSAESSMEDTAQKPEEVSQKPAETGSHPINIEEKETPLYIFSMSAEESMPLYFINGGEIPYVNMENWAGFMSFIIPFAAGLNPDTYDGEPYSLDYTADGDTVTLKREDGFYMNIDFAKDSFHFEDYDAFMRVGEESILDLATNVNLRSVDGEEEYLKRSAEDVIRYGNEIDMDLSKYDIDLIRDGEDYYVPLQTLSDILIAPRNFNILYNGENLYVAGAESLGNINKGLSEIGESYYSAEAKGQISEELAKFSYNEFCFVFDEIYGLKETHDISDFDSLAYNTGAKEILTGTDIRAADKVYYEMIYRFLDDKHSKFLNPSYLSGADAAKDFGKYLGEGKARNANNKLIDHIKEVQSEYYPEGIPGYEEVGDTAYIYFDSFMHLPLDYYNEAPDKDAEDTIGLISYSLGQILRENSPVKNVVLDLSCNTGGEDVAAAYTVAAFIGEGEISLENPNTGARVTHVYYADTNLDHRFDDADTLEGKGLRLFCLTSPVSFSCGNLVPCIFKNSGEVTIIGKQSGGGSCGSLGLSTAGGTLLRISGSNRISFMKNGSFYDIDQGAPVDYPVNDYEHFYDRKALTEYIDGLF